MSNETLVAEILPPSTALTVIPHTVIVAPKDEIARLVTVAREQHLRGRAYRLALGFTLLEIHAIQAKPGRGNFMKTVKVQIGMPYSTARDYMNEAAEARGYYESRQDTSAEVADDDPNDGTPDATQLAILAQQAKLLDAPATDEDLDRPTIFNWKFLHLPLQLANELKAAKAKLGSHRAALILINAAREASDENLAA